MTSAHCWPLQGKAEQTPQGFGRRWPSSSTPWLRRGAHRLRPAPAERLPLCQPISQSAPHRAGPGGPPGPQLPTFSAYVLVMEVGQSIAALQMGQQAITPKPHRKPTIGILAKYAIIRPAVLSRPGKVATATPPQQPNRANRHQISPTYGCLNAVRKSWHFLLPALPWPYNLQTVQSP